MIVYLITNKINGKRYVGKTMKNACNRWKQHITASKRGSKQFIHKAIRKYGPEAFDVSTLSVALNALVLAALEKFWIRELRTRAPHGYNLTDGGDGPCGLKMPAAAIEKMRKARLGKPSWNKGRPWSIESRLKMSEARLGFPAPNKGVPATLEARAKMRAAKLGRKSPPGTGAKISAARKGHKVTQETRSKISAGLQGHLVTKESRAKMSAARKLYFQRKKEALLA